MLSSGWESSSKYIGFLQQARSPGCCCIKCGVYPCLLFCVMAVYYDKQLLPLPLKHWLLYLEVSTAICCKDSAKPCNYGRVCKPWGGKSPDTPCTLCDVLRKKVTVYVGAFPSNKAPDETLSLTHETDFSLHLEDFILKASKEL